MVLWIKRLGGASLVGMMVLTCFDVTTRALGRPIFGAVEIVSFMATIVLACAMPMTHVEKGHVGVDLLIRKLPERSQHWVDLATAVVSAALFGLVSWQMFNYALTMADSGEVSMSLELPTHYIIFVVALAFAVLSLVIVVEVWTKLGLIRGSKAGGQ
jgi:TRAP-type C4-dicarboxylate transport system permease small subunit